jgi:hypothetical protein
MYRQEEIDARLRIRAERVIVKALDEKQHLTRPELADALARNGISASRFRLAYLLMSAELNGLICSGARRGKSHTYALLETRARPTPELSRVDAIGELVVRYFSSHGPATSKDLAWWSSLTLAEIRQGLESAGPRLERREVDGVTFWSAPNTTSAADPAPVDLLQGYDEYIVGFSETKGLLDLAGRAKSGAARRVPFNGVLLVDGQVGGHWKRTVTSRSVSFDIRVYDRLDASRRDALETAVGEHGRFLDLEAAHKVSLL